MPAHFLILISSSVGGAEVGACVQIRSHSPHVPVPRLADKEAAMRLLHVGLGRKF